MSDTSALLKKIPSVNLIIGALSEHFPQVQPLLLKRFVIPVLEDVRKHPKKYGLHKIEKAGVLEQLVRKMEKEFRDLNSGTLKPVINATGVVLHTGLGRAPLSEYVTQKMAAVGAYSNLEINLANGKRGQRTDHVAPLLRLLTGAEDGLAVNNNAAAVMLMLNTVGYRKEVILSRGEMVEIGGSFRLPEVMKMSGCKLREIGTTNKTHLSDYEEAISSKTGGILICHPSNYEIQGFTQKPQLEEIVDLANRYQLPLIYDLGSGSLIETERFGSGSEPEVGPIVDAGVHLISFSGDKLLGGPQSGIIVGKKEWIKKCNKNHLLRALRLDKFILKGIQETLLLYLNKNEAELPQSVRALISKEDELLERTSAFFERLPDAVKAKSTIVRSDGKVGSGAYPVLRLPSKAIRISPGIMKTEALAAKLRQWSVPVFSYIIDDNLYLDLRAVSPEQEDEIIRAFQELFNS